MRRLNSQSFLNGSEEYERIFHERAKNPPQAMDVLRWEALISRYNGGTLVDLGCLDSLIPLWAKQKYPDSEIWGLDQAEEAIAKLAKAHPEIMYTHGDVYDTTLPSHYFDYVVAGEVIEHLENPEDFFAEAFRILKSGGTLALTTPKDEELGGVDEHRHLWSYSKADIKELTKLYCSKVQVGEIPSWLRRRIKYSAPYIIAWCTKK